MDIGVKKISYEDFVKYKAAKKGVGGRSGSRREFIVCDRLEVGECVVLKYDTKDDFRRGATWAYQFCKRRNDTKNHIYHYETFSVQNDLTVYVAKSYKEDK